MKCTIISLFLVWLSILQTAMADVSRWRFGGEGGLDWGDWGRVNTMMDVEAVRGSIQPFELDPDENLLLRLGPWARWRQPSETLSRRVAMKATSPR